MSYNALNKVPPEKFLSKFLSKQNTKSRRINDTAAFAMLFGGEERTETEPGITVYNLAK